MPTLLKTLESYDLGLLRILAQMWGLPEPVDATPGSRAELAAAMLSPELVGELAQVLPAGARAALGDLLRSAGRLPWPRLVRNHGDLRQMGPARRVRERPHLQPVSGVEALFYRGLIGRAFFDTAGGPQEFGYIPDDLLPLLPPAATGPERPPGRPAREDEKAMRFPAGDRILDDLTTLLSAIRSGREAPADLSPDRVRFCGALLRGAGLLAGPDALAVDRVRDFLEAPRGEALAGLVRAWRDSTAIDELAMVPAYQVAAHFERDPVRLRTRVLEYLDQLPAGEWWSLSAFTAGLGELEPEFLRPSGELDSRYLKDRETGDFLDASAGWEAVEGAFIRWMLTGPIHWLGLVDLAGPDAGQSRGQAPVLLAVRASRWSRDLRAGEAPAGLPAEDRPVHVRSDGRISVPRLAPRAVRYLVARFCDWEEPVRDEYRFRASPTSLQAATDQGLRVGQLIGLLAKHAEGIPPNITKALKSWEQYGRAGRIETLPVLHLPSPEALDELRKSRAARFLGDILGPAAVALKPGSEERVLAALNELGYLAEITAGGS